MFQDQRAMLATRPQPRGPQRTSQATLKQVQQQRAAAHALFKSQVMRCRLDHRWLKNGRIQAILTVTLPNGHMVRHTAECDPHDILAAVRASNPAFVGFSLGGLWKGIKKVAKGVATSKVFKAAGTAMMAAAPFLGPLAPIALTAAAGMKASTALLAAKAHAAAGNTAAAQTLVSYAANIAKTPTVFHSATALATNASARRGAAHFGAHDPPPPPKMIVTPLSKPKPVPVPAKPPQMYSVTNPASQSKIYALLLKQA
jgi:hypothetical protein